MWDLFWIQSVLFAWLWWSSTIHLGPNCSIFCLGQNQNGLLKRNDISLFRMKKLMSKLICNWPKVNKIFRKCRWAGRSATITKNRPMKVSLELCRYFNMSFLLSAVLHLIWGYLLYLLLMQSSLIYCLIFCCQLFPVIRQRFLFCDA